MSLGLFEISALTNIPGLPVVLPKENVKHFLITNNHIKKIDEPKEFLNGIIISVKIGKEELLVLLKTVEAFESFKRNFKTDSIEWYFLN